MQEGVSSVQSSCVIQCCIFYECTLRAFFPRVPRARVCSNSPFLKQTKIEGSYLSRPSLWNILFLPKWNFIWIMSEFSDAQSFSMAFFIIIKSWSNKGFAKLSSNAYSNDTLTLYARQPPSASCKKPKFALIASIHHFFKWWTSQLASLHLERTWNAVALTWTSIKILIKWHTTYWVFEILVVGSLPNFQIFF